MKKIGVVLAGCGVYDGAEIHEAVITLLALARQGAQACCFAPDKPGCANTAPTPGNWSLRQNF